ncbi:MAG: hypothetical protein WAV93_12385 [Bacteroidales bacterium]
MPGEHAAQAARALRAEAEADEVVNWATRIILASNVLLFAFLIWAVAARGLQPAPADWKYQDLVTILLTAVAVILAAVTLFIAILAIWGYTALKDAAEKEARKVATDVAQSVAAREARAASRFEEIAGDGQGEDPLDKLGTALKSGSDV